MLSSNSLIINNMKNISSFTTIIILLLLAITACKDKFMERYPKDALSDPSFWATPQDLESFANGFYPLLATPSIFNRDVNQVSNFDDQSDNKTTSTPDPYLFGQDVPQATSGYWNTSAWATIRSTNYFLARYGKVKGDVSQIASYVAEIRFFRAWEYFKKIKLFGDVPWINKDLATNDENYLYKARDSRKLVMDSVLADLNYAVANLYVPSKVKKGRLNKDVALAFKSRVCLYEASYRKYHNLSDEQKFFTEAKNAATTLIFSNVYSLYNTGNPKKDYYNLFIQPDLRGNSESILCMVYLKDLLMQVITNRTANPGQTGYTKDFAESYLCTDGKPISVSPLYLGDDSLEMEMKNRDPRIRQTIDNKSIPFTISDNGTFQYNQYPMINFLCPSGYLQIKYHSPLASEYNYGQGINDAFIFRYAEVLLNYAEATAELGGITQTDLDKSINLLRDRVGLPHLTLSVGFTDPNWPNYGYALSSLLQEIRRERRVELVSEEFRWDDIVRWKAGKLLENPKTLVGIRVPPVWKAQLPVTLFTGRVFTSDYLLQTYNGIISRTWNDKLYLRWIPLQEITLSKNKLTQNPGW